MATSGRTTSAFLTWYSIHSRLIAMSPSRKRKRFSARNSAIRSLPTSRPKTSQSVVVRMRRVSALPMKPLTPRIRTRMSAPPEQPVAEGRRVEVFLPLGPREEDLDGMVVPAIDEDRALGRLDLPREGVVPAVGREARLPDRHLRAEEVGEGAGPRARHGTDEVVDLPRGAVPVDPPVLRLPAAEVASLREVERNAAAPSPPSASARSARGP